MSAEAGEQPVFEWRGDEDCDRGTGHQCHGGGSLLDGGGLPNFYKSDIQGYDKEIIALLPDETWDSIIGGVIENIDKPEFDIEKFVAFLDLYENKLILDKPDTIISTTEVLGYLNRTKAPGVDLGFWK